ncbi:restriction endonuclease subunit S [Vagococcus fluvialis]|uniref:restriction endonuclease subunit S n=2 Tax=Vagococcus fluvialis TaxID=2738 RepID=UPI001B87932D|nr:restriction endonuclease subunit S [Vagococcus fluvialis]
MVAWEQRKLKNIANYRNGKAHEKVEDINGKFTIINSRFISIDGKVKRHTNEQVEPMLKGEIAMVLSDLPNGKALAKVFLVDKDEKYTLNQRIAGITPKENMDSIFLSYRMNRNPYFLKFDSGVSQTNLSKPEVENFEALYPKKEEQTKIGNFFKQLDETITLQERELELLKLTKKSFLQQLFPETNQLFPNIRFANFQDEWQQRKFEDMLDIENGVRRGPFGSALKKEFFIKNSDYVVYEQQNAIYDNYETRYNISKEKFDELKVFKLLEKDFIMSGAGTIGRISRVPKGIKQGVFNQALIRFRINGKITDAEYFIQFIRAEKMQRKLTGANPGSAITNLVPMSEVKKWDILVPKVEEQIEIGFFLNRLDEAITLQKRKLDKLKKMKKSFLQKMFI